MQVGISETIGLLFKTHPDQTVQVAHLVMEIVMRRALQPRQSASAHKFAIYLIDDMVEYLGHQRLAQYWQQFDAVLCQFCTHRNPEVRQAACYGLGVFAANTQAGEAGGCVGRWLEVLVEATRLPKGDEKEKNYVYCKENAVSSIGKIIKQHG